MRAKFSSIVHMRKHCNQYVSWVCAATAAMIFSPWWYPKNIVWDMSVNNIIQAGGQFATAGALIFGIWQYHQSKKDYHHTIMFEEGKLLIQRMSTIPTPTRLNGNSDDFLILCDAVISLSNLARHLNIIIDEIDNEAQRSILKIYWHEFMFGNMIDFFTSAHYSNFIDYESKEIKNKIEQEAISKYPVTKINDRLISYKRAKFILQQEKSILLVSEAVNQPALLGAFRSFKNYFHDNGLIDKLKEPDLVRPDMRVFAPFLAALYELKLDNDHNKESLWIIQANRQPT